MPTFENGEGGFSVRTKINDAIERIESTGKQYATVADFTADVADGYTAPDGAVISAGPVQFQADSGAAIDGLPAGWKPFDKLTPDHFADNVTPGTTDMTTAFQRAFDAAGPTGTVECLPDGVYLVGEINTDCGKNLLGNDCDIVCRDASFLKFANGTAFTSSRVERCRIRPTLAPSVGSVGVEFDSPALNTRRSFEIVDVRFHGIDGLMVSEFGFEKYVRTNNASNPRFEDVRIDGTYNFQGDPTGQFASIGISLEGQSVESIVEHCKLQGLHTGVEASSYLQEGVQIVSTAAPGVRDGFVLRAVGDFGGPGMWLVNCHANAARTAYDLSNRIDVSIVSCTAYRGPNAFEEPYTGFLFEDTFGARISASGCVNSLVTGADDCTAFKFIVARGVTASSIECRNTKRGLVFEGACKAINVIAPAFYANGGFSDTMIEMSAGSDDVNIGAHEVLSTWANPYILHGVNYSQKIDYGRNKYNRVASVTESSPITRTLAVNKTSQMWIVVIGGSGQFDVTYDLSADGAKIGDFFDFYVNLPGDTGRRFIVRNGVGGSVLATMSTASSKRYGARFVFNGSGWQAAWINESVFM